MYPQWKIPQEQIDVFYKTGLTVEKFREYLFDRMGINKKNLHKISVEVSDYLTKLHHISGEEHKDRDYPDDIDQETTLTREQIESLVKKWNFLEIA